MCPQTVSLQVGEMESCFSKCCLLSLTSTQTYTRLTGHDSKLYMCTDTCLPYMQMPCQRAGQQPVWLRREIKHCPLSPGWCSGSGQSGINFKCKPSLVPVTSDKSSVGVCEICIQYNLSGDSTERKTMKHSWREEKHRGHQHDVGDRTYVLGQTLCI